VARVSVVQRGRRVVSAVLPLLTGLFLTSTVLAEPGRDGSWPRLLALITALATGLVLHRRRSRPRTVTALTAAGSAVVLLAAPDGLFPYAGLIALWTLTTTHPPRTSLPALGALLGVTTVTWPNSSPGDVPFALGVVIAVWALAEATRSRRAAIVEASRRAAEQEKARLARELHDVIAHSVSVVVIQAAAGDDVFDADPAAARRALRSIEAAGREALTELRRLLAAIGSENGPPDARRPQPGLDRLGDLAGPLRAAGLEVSIERVDDGELAVPAGVQLSAYRIVQEALTNAVRHARANRVEVRIEARVDDRSHDRTDDRTDDRTETRVDDRAGSLLEVTVTDDGSGPPPAEEPGRAGRADPTRVGLGIPGMRERAALLGGSLEAGPGPSGGFRVRARLPLRVPAG
jgi:signal transduction histidine kinase